MFTVFHVFLFCFVFAGFPGFSGPPVLSWFCWFSKFPGLVRVPKCFLFFLRILRFVHVFRVFRFRVLEYFLFSLSCFRFGVVDLFGCLNCTFVIELFLASIAFSCVSGFSCFRVSGFFLLFLVFLNVLILYYFMYFLLCHILLGFSIPVFLRFYYIWFYGWFSSVCFLVFRVFRAYRVWSRLSGFWVYCIPGYFAFLFSIAFFAFRMSCFCCRFFDAPVLFGFSGCLGFRVCVASLGSHILFLMCVALYCAFGGCFFWNCCFL